MSKITNEQKYTTAEERVKAFGEWCNHACNTCPIGDKSKSSYHCMAYWLALEADEEKPEPCFYCGSKCDVHDVYCMERSPCEHEHDVEVTKKTVFCTNDDCMYSSTIKPNEAEAIAAWNSRAGSETTK